MPLITVKLAEVCYFFIVRTAGNVKLFVVSRDVVET